MSCMGHNISVRQHFIKVSIELPATSSTDGI